MPFKAEIPAAQPTSNPSTPEESGDGGEVVRLPADTEDLLHKVHPAIFRNHPVFAILLVTIMVLGAIQLGSHYLTGEEWEWEGITIGGTAMLIGGWICLGGGALAFLIWWIQTRFVTLSVTTRRSIFQRGLIARETSEVQHDDVRNISIDQSFFQRILRVGTLKLSSSGQDDFEIVAHGIPAPESLTAIIRENQ